MHQRWNFECSWVVPPQEMHLPRPPASRINGDGSLTRWLAILSVTVRCNYLCCDRRAATIAFLTARARHRDEDTIRWPGIDRDGRRAVRLPADPRWCRRVRKLPRDGHS